MIDSLKDFIDAYCVIDEYGENYIKLSKFYDCYKSYCHDNSVATLDSFDLILKLNEYNIDIIIMNNEKWLKGIKFLG